MFRKLLRNLYLWLPTRSAIYILVMFWLVMQTFLFYTYGVKLVPDSLVRYLPLSQALLDNQFHLLDYNSRYMGYLLFLSFFIKFGLPYTAIVVVQTLISGLAAVCLYKLVFLIAENRVAAFLATFLFIAWKDVQYFNYFILTESLFTSFLIFSYYAVLRTNSGGKYTLFTALFVLVYTSILRPNGFIVLIAAFNYLVFLPQFRAKQSTIKLALAGGIFLGAGFIFLNSWLHQSFDLLGEYQKGEIIYGAPDYATSTPAALHLPPQSYAPLVKILFFIWYNPIVFMQLASLKILYFVSYIKPYHSWVHIGATVLVIYPMYYCSIVTLRLRTISWSKKNFALTAFICQTAIIALTVEDWDNRFSIPFIPYIFILGSIGLTHLLLKYGLPFSGSLSESDSQTLLKTRQTL